MVILHGAATFLPKMESTICCFCCNLPPRNYHVCFLVLPSIIWKLNQMLSSVRIGNVISTVYAVIKQRMQVYRSPYKNCSECGKSVLRAEGMRAFYRSFTTQLTMNIPFQSTHFVCYEFMQDLLNKERQYHPLSHMVSGGTAGAVAAAITTPLDVCKTLLNTQERCALSQQNAINGMVQAFKTIYQFRGFTGYFQGIRARIVYQVPSTAISWSVYEFFKYIITNRKSGGDDPYVTASAVHVHASSR